MDRALTAAPVATPQAAIQFGFGPIRHTRLRPVRHAFSYPGCFLRLRIDGGAARAAAPGLGWLFGYDRRGLVSFFGSDHGDGQTPPDEWVRGLCSQAGVNADGALWLHTFPRLLGYVFKPVSFWFCHRADGAMVAVVAEVNNTFGERHCYLLAQPDGSALPQGREMRAHKVFHVSPFCAVDGDYVFRFLNRPDRALARIDYHDAQGPLLLTSLSGELVAGSRASVRRALFGQPMFTLGVMARIHWQALKLWLARVPFHRKPAPPDAFVSRGL
jgi:DUF1365 family protein